MKRLFVCFFFKNEEGKSHYCTITNLAGLVSRQVRSHNKGSCTFICDYCLNYFGTQKLLDKHEESCSQHKAVKTTYPKPDDNILTFKNIQNCIECPVKFYFEKESILEPIDEMSAFCLYPVFRVEEKVKLKFLDSFRFTGKSLASLVETTTTFEHTDRCFTSEQ